MPARRWSELEPRERRARLVKVHPELNEDCLLACGLAVPELVPQLKAQKSKEDRLWVVLRYFGDEGHPQPEGEVRYGPAINGNAVKVCPRWERLPALEDDGSAAELPARVVPQVESHSRPVPEKTFWPIFKLAVGANASAREISKLTDKDPDLAYVNRIKAGVLVRWVEQNPEEALRRLRVAELPPGFSATPDGVVFPNPPKRA